MSPPSLHTGQGVIRRLWGVFWELLTINFGARAPLKAPESVVAPARARGLAGARPGARRLATCMDDLDGTGQGSP